MPRGPDDKARLDNVTGIHMTERTKTMRKSSTMAIAAACKKGDMALSTTEANEATGLLT